MRSAADRFSRRRNPASSSTNSVLGVIARTSALRMRRVIAVRLTAEEIAALDAYAAREHLSRSEAIRRALAGYAA